MTSPPSWPGAGCGGVDEMGWLGDEESVREDGGAGKGEGGDG